METFGLSFTRDRKTSEVFESKNDRVDSESASGGEEDNDEEKEEEDMELDDEQSKEDDSDDDSEFKENSGIKILVVILRTV